MYPGGAPGTNARTPVSDSPLVPASHLQALSQDSAVRPLASVSRLTGSWVCDPILVLGPPWGTGRTSFEAACEDPGSTCRAKDDLTRAEDARYD